MAQNIYDNAEFFAGYRELRRTESGLNLALEWPAMRALLPSSLGDRDVLDLGCGMGYFARQARQLGARRVTAVDLSTRMLAEARASTNDEAITFIQSSMEQFSFPTAAFDLIVSSLAFHYVADYAALIGRVAQALKPGGRLVFSVEHPLSTCLATQDWHRDADGKPLHWPVGNYQDESIRHTQWFVDDVIKYHRTVATYVNTLLDAGLRLLRLNEPSPDLSARPDLALQNERPPFLLISAQRPGND